MRCTANSLPPPTYVPPQKEPQDLGRTHEQQAEALITEQCTLLAIINDIPFPSHIASNCPSCRTCKLGYLSDRIPLMVSIPTSTLNIQIPRLSCIDHPKQTPICILARPASNSDLHAFTHCLSDPTHRVTQELEETLEALNPACQEALAFLENLQNVSARNTKIVTSLCGRAASVVVGDLAKQVANLIYSSHRVALKICETKMKEVSKL